MRACACVCVQSSSSVATHATMLRTHARAELGARRVRALVVACALLWATRWHEEVTTIVYADGVADAPAWADAVAWSVARDMHAEVCETLRRSPPASAGAWSLKRWELQNVWSLVFFERRSDVMGCDCGADDAARVVRACDGAAASRFRTLACLIDDGAGHDGSSPCVVAAPG